MKAISEAREAIRREPVAFAAVMVWTILGGLYWGYTVLGPFLFR